MDLIYLFAPEDTSVLLKHRLAVEGDGYRQKLEERYKSFDGPLEEAFQQEEEQAVVDLWEAVEGTGTPLALPFTVRDRLRAAQGILPLYKGTIVGAYIAPNQAHMLLMASGDTVCFPFLPKPPAAWTGVPRRSWAELKAWGFTAS